MNSERLPFEPPSRSRAWRWSWNSQPRAPGGSSLNTTRSPSSQGRGSTRPAVAGQLVLGRDDHLLLVEQAGACGEREEWAQHRLDELHAEPVAPAQQ